MLEAAIGALRRDSLLRRKILVMMAILETTPDFASHFEPQSMGVMKLALQVCRYAILSVIKIGTGLLLYAVFVRPPRLVLKNQWRAIFRG